MNTTTTDIDTIHQTITTEVVKIIGAAPQRWTGRLLSVLLSSPLRKFSALAATFDRLVAEEGFPRAARAAVEQFTSEFHIFGSEYLPDQGPLIIIGNHPGGLDAFLIAASLPRDDIQMVVSGVPFFESLPSIGEHMIHAPYDPHGRVGVVRRVIRHLQDGGSLLIFPSGNVDPDPAVMPGLEAALESWSASLDIMLRKVPESRVVTTIISGVLARKYFKHPLARIRRAPRDRQKMAEFLQILRQLFRPDSADIRPCVTFDPPLEVQSWVQEANSDPIVPRLVDRAKQNLEHHRKLPCFPEDMRSPE